MLTDTVPPLADQHPYVYNSPERGHTAAYLWPTVVAAIGDLSQARVLELGCGNGALAAVIAPHCREYVGIDPSASGVQIARSRGIAQFEVASTDDPDLAARFGVFDVVISLEVIEHVPSTARFMRAFRSLLANHGLGVISTPYHGWLKNLLVIATGRFDSHFDPLWEGGHLKFFSEAKLRRAATDAGLTCSRIIRVGRIPPLAKSMIAVVGCAASTAR